MARPHESSTRGSLLGFLGGTALDGESASRFLAKYSPAILAVVRRHGIDGQDAEDVFQEVMRKLLQGFHTFHRRGSGSFRAWLRCVSGSACVDWLRGSRRISRAVAAAVGKALATGAERRYEVELMRSALMKARLEFHQRTWEMFELAKIDGRPAREVARKLGVSVFTVYGATQRVSRRLNEIFDILRRLDEHGR